MDFNTIRQKYVQFFVQKAGHAQIPAAPLIPPDDPTTLFTGSGMQQLVPYLKGESHPMGARLVDSQPSFRAEDIEEVGDNRHTTMFEMLGNWSLGDYFKAEQLPWIWEFFTKVVELDPEKLYVTLYEGDKIVPRDDQSYTIWKQLGVSDDHIYFYEGKKNWWSRAGVPENMPVGEVGGPTSEIFFEFTQVNHDVKFGEKCHPNCDCGRFLEIGNSVFMEYVQTENGLQKLPAQNVDFGGGLERITAAAQNTPDVFQIDVFAAIIDHIVSASNKPYEGEFQAPMRVIADHLRAAVFMIAQGIEPGNKMQGYVLRRLLRRAAVKGRKLQADITTVFTASIPAIIDTYSQAGFIAADSRTHVTDVITQEMNKFAKVLDTGIKEIDRQLPKGIDEQFAFHIYQSYGFPFEITAELLLEKNITLDQAKFNHIFNTHKQKSRSASAGMFKGGLADHSVDVTKLHTTTHLLQKALQLILGDHVRQEGSNITAERLRFDYFSPTAPTDEQLKQIEQLINQKIRENLPVTKTIEDKAAAQKSGAMAFFKETYPDKVSVYTIGKDPQNDWFSRELCGGPHVNSTGEIQAVTIKQDKSIGANIRRIYVTLKPAHGNQKHPQQA